jgi:hypothetical protein
LLEKIKNKNFVEETLKIPVLEMALGHQWVLSPNLR